MTDTISRRQRTLVAAVWIGCRVAALIAAPAVAWIDVADAAVECHCTHGADTTCPMHHQPAGGTRVCAMQAAGDWVTAAIESMLGLAAPHRQRVEIDDARYGDRGHIIAVTPFPLVSVPPDHPPPRA